ncbi:MAG: murein hydrolase activator NlpD [Arsenophonus sp. ET-YP4-MAG3]
MNFNIIKFTVRWVIIYIIIILMLIGCSTLYHSVAPINNINDSNYQINTYSPINALSKNILISSSPKNISINNQNSCINKFIYQPFSLKHKININDHIIYNRNYNNIEKGTYSGNIYTVKQGDTLFYISWITGFNYRDLAERNKIIEPYNLNVGQILNMTNDSINSKMIINNYVTNKNNRNINSKVTNEYPSSVNKKNSKKISSKTYELLTLSTSPQKTAFLNLNNNKIINIVWPTNGKVIEVFSDLQGGNKGIDISGSHGQSIFATAKGKVVYSGNALRGYGNLIIIKHNDDYLSAYAHNDTILVREQQLVQAGQKIATMGSTDTSSVKLHFEIRYKGKSVNPLLYLSQR